MTKIDAIDKKLLFELFQNCRRSDKEIGHNVRLSKQSVNYRIRRLENQGVIRGHTISLDKSKFGLSRFTVFLQFPKEVSLEEAIKRLKKFEQISTIIECLGKWDLYATIWAKDTGDLHKIIKEILIQIPINRISILSVIYSHMLLYEILKQKEIQKLHYTRPLKFRKIKLDSTDTKILEILKADSRESITKISEITGLSITAVRERIKKLVNAGIISRFFSAIDMAKLGYQEYQFLCKIDSRKYHLIDHFIDFLKTIKEVSYILQTIGEWNLCFSVYCNNPEDLRSFIKKINSHSDNILVDYDTVIIGHVV